MLDLFWTLWTRSCSPSSGTNSNTNTVNVTWRGVVHSDTRCRLQATALTELVCLPHETLLCYLPSPPTPGNTLINFKVTNNNNSKISHLLYVTAGKPIWFSYLFYYVVLDSCLPPGGSLSFLRVRFTEFFCSSSSMFSRCTSNNESSVVDVRIVLCVHRVVTRWGETVNVQVSVRMSEHMYEC